MGTSSSDPVEPGATSAWRSRWRRRLRVGLRRPAERLVRLPNRIWGRLTARHRALPDFLVIGAMKGGTTSLFHYLSQHPEILTSSIKQVRYFDGGLDSKRDHYDLGELWYRSHFPLRSTLERRRAITGEASPMYLFHPLAAVRIRRLVPEVKLVVTLRDPSTRAVSHYWHAVRNGEEERPMMDAFQCERARLEGEGATRSHRSYSFIRHSYLARGLYEGQLRRFVELFDRRQLFVMTLDELSADPSGALRRLFIFLGVDPEVRIVDLSVQNGARRPSSIPIGPRRLLAEVFQPENEKLYKLLARRFDWGASS